MNETDPLTALIERRTGLEISTLGGPHAIQVASARSRELSGISDPREWLKSLERSTETWQSFLHLIVVPETFFFRYPESFDALSSWISRCPRRPLRILSLPCSTGEEAYSIAITLARKASLAPEDFIVDGIDVSTNSIRVARSGIYPASSFRGQSPPERWFRKTGEDHQVADAIRRQVRFETGNFWETAAPGGLYDVIFCRNLLIYFSTARQAAALAKLDTLLHPDGLLFLGPAEMPLASRRGWKSASFPMAFACGKPGSPTTAAPPARRLTFPKPPAPPAMKAHAPRITPQAPEAWRKQPDAPQAPTLETIRGLADRGALPEARASLDHYLQSCPPDATSFLLAGLLAEATGDRPLAERQFRKALYLSPDHPEAISHLAWLLKTDGRLDAARKLLARAQRLHER